MRQPCADREEKRVTYGNDLRQEEQLDPDNPNQRGLFNTHWTWCPYNSCGAATGLFPRDGFAMGLHLNAKAFTASVERTSAKTKVSSRMQIAVAVRTHRNTKKLQDLVHSLEGSDLYDLYLVANETQATVDSYGVRKLSHTCEILAEIGPEYQTEHHLVHCSDFVLNFLLSSLPDSDFIFMIEDDVYFPHGARGFVEELVQKLRSSREAFDLVATRVRRAEADWWWYQDGRRLFVDVHKILFPFVGMSARAIRFVHRNRMKEASVADGRRLVFCEAFVPSSIALSSEFNMVDMNQLFPGSYDDDTFTVGFPFMLEEISSRLNVTSMMHPVFSVSEYLSTCFIHAKSKGGQVSAFLQDLENKAHAIPPRLFMEYSNRAGALMLLAMDERLRHLEQMMLKDGQRETLR